MRGKKRIRWICAAAVLGVLTVPAAIPREHGDTGPDCLRISGPRLVAAELARLDSRFLAFPPDTDFGYPPAPGKRRSVTLSNGGTVCIERASRVLEESEIQAALEVPESPVHAAVLDFPRKAFPTGKLRFPWDGVAPPARGADAVLWRGSIEYEPGRTVALWARVRLWRETKCFQASTSVARGEAASPETFETSDCDAAAILAGALGPASDIPWAGERGPVAARTIRKGEWLTADLFSEAALVAARRPALLEVYSGGARLRFPVTPEESGTAGKTIWVRGTVTRERLRARVAGLDRLVLTLPGRENTPSARATIPRNGRPGEAAP